MARKLTILIPLILTFAIFCAVTTAAEVSTFHVGQAVARLPEIKVYADILDQGGRVVLDIQSGQLTVSLAQNALYVKEIKRFDQSKEGVAFVFLVDISRSLDPQQFEQMKSALHIWVDNMRESDRAAIVSFGDKMTIVQDYTGDKNALNNGIKTLAVSDHMTQLHQGIAKAIELGHRADTNLPTRRVILTLSDGEDDFPGGMTREEVLAAMKEDRIPLYAIGFSPRGGKGDTNLKKLGEFARTSGGEFFSGNGADLAKLYETIQKKILASYLIVLNAASVQAEGKSHRLQLTLNSGSSTLTDGLDIRILAPTALPSPITPPPKPWYMRIPLWGYIAAGFTLLLIVLLLIRAHQKKQARLAAEVEERRRLQEKKEVAARKAEEEAAARAAEEKRLRDEQVTHKKTEPPGLKMKLSVLGSPGVSRDYGISLVTRAIIGRSSECDLALTDDEEISKRHCELFLEGGYVLISDLNSTNGTFVNGVPIKTGHRIKNGDLVMLGRTEMRVQF